MARPLLMMVLVLGAAAATARAGAQPAAYGGGDRYGPTPASPPPPATMTTGYGAADASGYGRSPAPLGPVAMRGRILAWPGKVQPRLVATAASVDPSPDAAVARAFATRRYTSPAPGQPSAPRIDSPAYPAVYRSAEPQGARQSWRSEAPVRIADAPPPLPPAARYASASIGDDGWRPVFAARPAAAAMAPAPVRAAAPSATGAYPAYSPSLAAARAAAPRPMLSADRRYGYDPTLDHTVRFYSVARPFGLRPDPAPIPPQFFTATADLGGDPPGPLPVSHTTASTRAAVVGGDSGGQ